VQQAGHGNRLVIALSRTVHASLMINVMPISFAISLNLILSVYEITANRPEPASLR